MVFGTVAPAWALTDELVPGSAIGTTYSGAGEVSWLVDGSNGPAASVTSDVFDGRSALKLTLPNVNTVTSVFRSFGQGTRPTDIPALLNGASYSYAGFNVNFQLGLFYTPANPDFGPPGTGAVGTTCTQATDGGVVRPGMCYTALKFETGQTSPGSYTTITLGDKQAPFNGAGNPGWWNTSRIGQYASNDRTVTLNQMLAEMESYEVYAVGVSTGNTGGTGSDPHDDAWVLNLRFGGTSYSFGSAAPTPAPATAPPAPDTDGIEQFITDEGIDVAQQTTQFVTTGTQNTDLSKVDPSKPVNGEYENWSDPTDAFADVFSYSLATHLGTFPIVNGNVVVSNLNLPNLSPGPHYLVLQGQTSGTVGIVLFNVIGLASTGVAMDTVVVLGIAATALLAFGVWFALGAARVRRRETSAS